MKNLGIYIHIPFCKKKCDYCDFISFENKETYIENYIKALKIEIDNIKIDKDKYLVNTIYIGGGTPSYIKSEYIVDILNTVKQKFNIMQNVETTIEINPGTITKDKLQEYYKNGINRLSFGLQTTNNQLLKTIGRIHTYEEFLENYKLARQIGFKNINADLIIGLPTQNINDIEIDIEKLTSLNLEHISVYSLIVEENTKLEEKINNKELYLPSENIERQMYWKVKNMLQQKGFKHYEISNFAIPNFESKHNMSCWDQQEYIGFGVAAHSYINDNRYSNTENLEKYIVGTESFDYSNIRTIHEIQTKDDKMKEYMLLGLRKIDGVKISEFKNRFIDNPIYLYRESLSKLVIQELLEIDEDNIKLTEKGIDLANIVWEEFI